MLKQISLLLFVFVSAVTFGQDITATVKTVSSATPGKDFTVEITINKPGVNGFMKYFQDLPVGYVATDIDSKGGNFTFADNGAKVIWISPPSVDQFILSYKITVPTDAVGSIGIGGKISYVVGNERKSLDIENQVVSMDGKGGAAIPPPAKTDTPVVKETPPPPAESQPVVITETVKSSPVEEKPAPVEPKKETPPPVVKTTPAKAPVTAAAVTSGRTYRVQIGAFSQKPQIYGVPELTSLVLDNGMTKCFSGNFKTYEEAGRRKKEMIERGFSGAFVVAFENGKIVK